MLCGLMVAMAAPRTTRAGEFDCDNNGVPDVEELSGNDCNANGLLDVCENETLATVAEITGIRRTFFYDDEGDMAVDGDTAVVGDPLVFIPGVGGRGLVYCYAYSESAGWQPTQVLSQEPQVGQNFFGNRIALDGDRLAVGATGARLETNRYGAVYCYRRVDGIWELDQTVVGENPRIYFGQQVALDGNRLFVGEYNKGSGPTSTGSGWPRVSAYVDRGNGFELEQTFPIRGGGSSFDHVLFGNIFVVSGEILVVVDPQIIGDPASVGSAHFRNGVAIHEWNSRGWRAVARVSLDEQFPNDYFRLGLGDCLIDNEAGRIILTPGRIGDGFTFESAFVLEKSGDEWQVAQRIRGGPASSRWVEKSAAGYFLGQYELVFDEIGYTTIEHPDLAGVYDRSRRSGNWWLTLVSGSGAVGAMTIDEVSDDCNADGVLDHCEIDAGAFDVDGNLVPDHCQLDCNNDGVPDESQLALGDCNGNGILDVCDVDALDPDGDGDVWTDCNGNLTPDACEPDCDGNGVPDSCDLDASDPDGDGVVATDCDANGQIDQCDIDRGMARIAEIRPTGDIAGLTFGFSLAMDGDVLAVATASDDLETPIRDRVYVYRRVGTQWIEEAVLRGADYPENLLTFGFNLALEGDVLVVQGESTTPSTLSHFYTFVHESGVWQHLSTFSTDLGFQHGTDLALDAGRLAISADFSQSIRFYELFNDAWTETDVVSLTEFGALSERIALHGDLLIAGYTANAAQVFRHDGAAWNHVAHTRHIGQTVVIGQFARPVTDGEIFAVGNRTGGCPTTTGSAVCGAAQVYRFAGEDLLLENLLYGRGPDEASPFPAFGMSIALAANRLIVGAPASGTNVGRIDVFKRGSGDWELQDSIDSPLAPAEMGFGSEIAASGKLLAVAANGRSYPGTEETDDDVIFIYEIDLDVDDNGVLDTCQPDCDANNYPDEGERTIPGMVHALLHGGAVCVFDINDDGAVNGLDIGPLIDQLLAGP